MDNSNENKSIVKEENKFKVSISSCLMLFRYIQAKLDAEFTLLYLALKNFDKAFDRDQLGTIFERIENFSGLFNRIAKSHKVIKSDISEEDFDKINVKEWSEILEIIDEDNNEVRKMYESALKHKQEGKENLN